MLAVAVIMLKVATEAENWSFTVFPQINNHKKEREKTKL